MGRHPILTVTDRELDALRLVALGFTQGKAAKALGLTRVGLRGRLVRASLKLGQPSVLLGVVEAKRRGLI